MRRTDSSMTTFALFQRFALLGTPLDRALLFYFVIANLLPPRVGWWKRSSKPQLILVHHYLSSPRASCANAMRESGASDGEEEIWIGAFEWGDA